MLLNIDYLQDQIFKNKLRAASPDSFDLNKQVGMDCYNYAYSCRQIIGSVCSELKDFDIPVKILSKNNTTKYCYADYNSRSCLKNETA